MKQDEVKREEAYDVVQDCALKVETIEGGTVYMLTTINSHPTHQKTLFSMGNIQIFMEVNRNLSLYRGEILSTFCLNNEIDWDQRYFDKLKGVLSQGGKDFRYSFKPTEDQSDFEYTLRVGDRIQVSKKACEVTILKVAMKLQPQFSSSEIMFTTFLTMLNRKQKSVNNLTETVTKLEQSRSEVLSELAVVTQLKNKTETDLFNKFTILLNKKKLKIRELHQFREFGQQQNLLQDLIQQQLSVVKDDVIKHGEMIDEGMIVPTQMSQSPMLSSLFEQPIRRRKPFVPSHSVPPPTKDEMIQSKKEKLEEDGFLIDLEVPPRKKNIK